VRPPPPASLFETICFRDSMELTLNLFWLLLTVPALLLWRREGMGCRHRHRSWLLLLSLGCLLILLFPVISASDDLRALRMEAEDPVTGDTLRGLSAGGSSQSADHQSPVFALPPAQVFVSLGTLRWGATVPVATPKAGIHLFATRAGRAPPLSFFG
jgi:hypothetical protein